MKVTNKSSKDSREEVIKDRNVMDDKKDEVKKNKKDRLLLENGNDYVFFGHSLIVDEDRVRNGRGGRVIETSKEEKDRNKKIKKTANRLKNYEGNVKPDTIRKPDWKNKGKKDKKSNSNKSEPSYVWRWWEEDSKLPEGVKWKFLEHKGPMFVPEYEPLPDNVQFKYNGDIIRLNLEAEEGATFYGRMLDHDYTTKHVFNKNFFKDWRNTMTKGEKDKIRDLSKCDFSEIDAYYKKLSQERNNRTSEEKAKERKRQQQIIEELGYCTVDGYKQKIGNFRIEPPSLFRGRGEHPKMGRIKKRIQPEDVIINCSKDSKIPSPPLHHCWNEVRDDNSVTWLASWTENIQGQHRYVMLNSSSRLKGEKDWHKYEKARKLKNEIGKIRADYMEDMGDKDIKVRQRAVALYFIDMLALRAGHEKDEDEKADTVGCCSLRVEHIKLHDKKDGKDWVVVFDFLGKDSIRYHNEVEVDKKVFRNIKSFMEKKDEGDELFDRLNTSWLNIYLDSLMNGLTAKVFRTFNASITLQKELDKRTKKDDSIAAKMLSYNRANRAVAILCNHRKGVSKNHDKTMERLKLKIKEKEKCLKSAEKDLERAKNNCKKGKGSGDKETVDKCKKVVTMSLEQLEKLEIRRTDREENRTLALGTSKLNYLDPRISVQWCKTYQVPIEKVYNKTQRERFHWAIHMVMDRNGPIFRF